MTGSPHVDDWLIRHRRGVFRALQTGGDVAVAALVYLTCQAIVFGASSVAAPSPPLALLYGCGWLAALSAWGLTDSRPHRSGSELSGRAAAAAVSTLGGVGVLATIHSSFAAAPRFVLPLVAALALATVLSRAVQRSVLSGLSRRGIGLRRVVLVGDAASVQRAEARIRAHPWSGIQIVGRLTPESEPRPRRQPGVQVDRPEAILEVFGSVRPHQVLITRPIYNNDELLSFVEACRAAHLDVTVIPDPYESAERSPRLRSIGSLPLLAYAGVGTPSLVGWLRRNVRPRDGLDPAMAATSAQVPVARAESSSESRRKLAV